MKDVVIVGAGITGLTLAYRLEQAGLQVSLLEASERTGGVLQSIAQDEYLLELAANSSIQKYSMLHLIEELGMTSRLVYPNIKAQNRYLVHKQNSHLTLSPVPKSFLQVIKTPLLTISEKLRVILEPFQKTGILEDESVASFMTRRFGTGFSEKIVAPMLGGIWAADISQLSTRSALSALWEMEQASGSILISGAKRVFGKKSEANKIKPKLISFKEGMEELPRRLEHMLRRDTLQTQASVLEVIPTRDSVTLYFEERGQKKEIQTQLVILTTPGAITAKLISNHAEKVAAQIAKVPYAPLGVIHFAIEKKSTPQALNGFGFLVPPKYGLALLGCIFSSSLFPGRAPEGKHLLTCFVGGAIRPELSKVHNKEVEKQAKDEIRMLLNISGEIKVPHSHHWGEAVPNYPLQHFVTQELADSYEKEFPNVHLASHWRSGISVGDRVECAERLAKKILRKRACN